MIPQCKLMEEGALCQEFFAAVRCLLALYYHQRPFSRTSTPSGEEPFHSAFTGILR